MDGIVNKNTHFVSFLGMDMLPWNAFIHSHASGKKPLMFEGQFRCRDVIGARAECDLATVYHLTNKNSISWGLLILNIINVSHQCEVWNGDWQFLPLIRCILVNQGFTIKGLGNAQ